MTLDEFQESLFNQIAHTGDKPIKIRDSKGVLQNMVGFKLEENVCWTEVTEYINYSDQIEYVELILKHE